MSGLRQLNCHELNPTSKFSETNILLLTLKKSGHPHEKDTQATKWTSSMLCANAPYPLGWELIEQWIFKLEVV